MKKGCFVKSIIIITIIVAAILYIIENKFDDFVLIPAKNIFIPVLTKGIDKEMEGLKPSAEKDSLQILIHDYLAAIKEKSIPSKDSIEEVINTVKTALADSIVTPKELIEIKKLMEIKK